MGNNIDTGDNQAKRILADSLIKAKESHASGTDHAAQGTSGASATQDADKFETEARDQQRKYTGAKREKPPEGVSATSGQEGSAHEVMKVSDLHRQERHRKV